MTTTVEPAEKCDISTFRIKALDKQIAFINDTIMNNNNPHIKYAMPFFTAQIAELQRTAEKLQTDIVTPNRQATLDTMQRKAKSMFASSQTLAVLEPKVDNFIGEIADTINDFSIRVMWDNCTYGENIDYIFWLKAKIANLVKNVQTAANSIGNRLRTNDIRIRYARSPLESLLEKMSVRRDASELVHTRDDTRDDTRVVSRLIYLYYVIGDEYESLLNICETIDDDDKSLNYLFCIWLRANDDTILEQAEKLFHDISIDTTFPKLETSEQAWTYMNTRRRAFNTRVIQLQQKKISCIEPIYRDIEKYINYIRDGVVNTLLDISAFRSKHVDVDTLFGHRRDYEYVEQTINTEKKTWPRTAITHIDGYLERWKVPLGVLDDMNTIQGTYKLSMKQLSQAQATDENFKQTIIQGVREYESWKATSRKMVMLNETKNDQEEYIKLTLSQWEKVILEKINAHISIFKDIGLSNRIDNVESVISMLDRQSSSSSSSSSSFLSSSSYAWPKILLFGGVASGLALIPGAIYARNAYKIKSKKNNSPRRVVPHSPRTHIIKKKSFAIPLM